MASDPFAVLAEFERLARLRLWPGFEPKVPLALSDGQRTILFRHPAPPSGFAKFPDRSGVWIFSGRHPAIHANTALELNGIYTATLIMDERRSAKELAAMLLHEAFHVFQRERYPDWTANEAELFTYPVEDIEVLKLRRLETEALRRALAAEGDAASGWGRAFLELRGRRFARLPDGSVTYEQALELFEGLARYIEARAVGAAWENLLPVGGFAPEDIRRRCYEVGAALGLLLDRLLPDWKERLEAGKAEALDRLLELGLERLAVPAKRFSPSEEEAAFARAEADLEELLAERAKLEQEFLARPGWRITLLTREEPFWPQGFDPLNVRRLGGGRLLHTRWLKLGNARGTVEVFGEVLTEAAGDHPLFHGVQRMMITGLPAEPRLARAEGGHVRLEAKDLHLELQKAQVEFQHDDAAITVEL
jgi:hypothetical protein